MSTNNHVSRCYVMFVSYYWITLKKQKEKKK